MAAGVLDAIEYQAISGDGSGENCTGILHTAGTTAVAFTTDVATTLRRATTALQQLGEVPTAWALSPADAEQLDLLRWGTSGGLLTGGYENDTKMGFGTSDNIFGPSTVARVVSPSVPAGTAILADWKQLKLFTRETMRIDLDASGVLFQKNQIQLRAEARVGVGVLRPQSFAIVDLTS
ncbi:phage major capsid protein [Mycobacterium intermedium]